MKSHKPCLIIIFMSQWLSCSCHFFTRKYPERRMLVSVCLSGSFHRLGISPLPSSSLLPWQLGCCGNTMHLGDTSFVLSWCVFCFPFFFPAIYHWFIISLKEVSLQVRICNFWGQLSLFVALNGAMFRTVIDSRWRGERRRKRRVIRLWWKIYIYN